MLKKLIQLIICLFIAISCSAQNKELSILQFNIWQEGTKVENGFEGIVDNIINTNPDMVTFSEVRNYNSVDFITHLTNALKEKGLNYYGESSVSTGIITKYPIVEQIKIYPYKNDAGSIIKTKIDIEGKTIVLYSAHLDYRHYACYLPRGYNGSTWKKMNTIITSPDSILTQSSKSRRIEAIKSFIKDSKYEIEKENIVILGGDFNEPSHLDWADNTKYLWEHNGSVVKWSVSKALYNNGFIDSYRKIYPDVINYPGFTFPSDNSGVDISKLTWAPDADERDRIDFIYYYPNKDLSLKDAAIVGPSTSIVRSQRIEEQSKDHFILPKGVWPTDHKAIIAIFKLK